MQPEYPKTYRQLQRLLHDTLQNYRRSNSYFANVPARILPEGHTTRLIRDDGSVDEPKHRPYKEEALFDASEQFDLSAELVLERLTKAMSDMISSETRDWIQVIDETTSNTGQRQEGPLSWESILDVVAMLDWEFDTHGNPSGIEILGSPETAERV